MRETIFRDKDASSRAGRRFKPPHHGRGIGVAMARSKDVAARAVVALLSTGCVRPMEEQGRLAGQEAVRNRGRDDSCYSEVVRRNPKNQGMLWRSASQYCHSVPLGRGANREEIVCV